MKEQLVELLKQYGPAILTLIVGYYSGKASKAENKTRIAELELKLKENHDKIDKDNSSISDIDGVNKIAGPK